MNVDLAEHGSLELAGDPSTDPKPWPRSRSAALQFPTMTLAYRFLKILWLACWACSVSGAWAQDIHIFKPTSEQRHSLAPYLYFLDDPEGTLTIEQVMASPDAFAPLRPDKPLGYDYKNKALWLRVTMDLSQYPGPRGFLSYDYEHIGNLRLFRVSPRGMQTMELDEHWPREGRPYDIREYLLPVDVDAGGGPEVYYIRLASHTRYLRADFSWSGAQGAIESIHKHALIYGLFFGGLLVMWLYNLTLYAHLRDRAYLYYVYYLGCFTATFTHVYGLSSLLISLNPLWEAVFAACGYGAVHGMALFTRQFLSLRTTWPWLDRYLQFFQWLLFIGGCAAFFQPVGRPFVYLSYLLFFVLPGMVLAGILRWRQGYTPAGVFSLGWAIFGAALGMRAMQTVNLLPESIITSHAVMVASVLEAVIFSIALAYRIKLNEAERNEALDRTAKREREILEAQRHTLELRVAERTQSLKDSLDARRLMLANVSHELRSPVNALRLLLDACALNSHRDIPQVMQNARTITTHMSQLVENLLLLDTEQQRVGTGPGLSQNFDLGDEITTTAQLLGPLRQKSAATLDIQADACHGVTVRGDLTSLRRILINLLSNAFNFTERGSVILRASLAYPEGPGRVWLTLQVTDTGHGIPDHLKNQIFEAFVTSGPESGHTGTGLGLAISTQLARRLGGRLHLVSSTLGQGSTFECELPFDIVDKQLAHDVSPVAPSSSRRLKLLLAEDCPVTAEAVQVILRQLRHDVVHVGSYSALERALLSGEHFDVALVDHRLPGGLGLDLIKAVVREGQAQQPRFVLMTADVTPELLTSAKSLCSDIVTKPTTAAVLLQLLGMGPELAEIAQPPSSLGHPRLDPGPLTMLKSAGAQHAALVALSERFRQTVAPQLDALQAMLQGLPADAPLSDTPLAEGVHRLRSACLTLGAMALAHVLQQWLQSGTRARALVHGQAVLQEFNDTLKELSTWLQQMQTTEG